MKSKPLCVWPRCRTSCHYPACPEATVLRYALQRASDDPLQMFAFFVYCVLVVLLATALAVSVST
jgi:hypothetical protein